MRFRQAFRSAIGGFDDAFALDELDGLLVCHAKGVHSPRNRVDRRRRPSRLTGLTGAEHGIELGKYGLSPLSQDQRGHLAFNMVPALEAPVYYIDYPLTANGFITDKPRRWHPPLAAHLAKLGVRVVN